MKFPQISISQSPSSLPLLVPDVSPGLGTQMLGTVNGHDANETYVEQWAVLWAQRIRERCPLGRTPWVLRDSVSDPHTLRRSQKVKFVKISG